MSRPDRPNPGVGAKPNDSEALPLCWRCHNRQHAGSEEEFWRRAGIDPFALAAALYAVSPDVDAMTAIVLKPGENQ